MCTHSLSTKGHPFLINSRFFCNASFYLHARSIRIAEDVMFDGEVLQHPTTPVVKETNMKKKATMKRAIMERPMSEKGKRCQVNLIVLGTDKDEWDTCEAISLFQKPTLEKKCSIWTLFVLFDPGEFSQSSPRFRKPMVSNSDQPAACLFKNSYGVAVLQRS